jgi:CubicO group peptidase (beta-lactamase class C family)
MTVASQLPRIAQAATSALLATGTVGAGIALVLGEETHVAAAGLGCADRYVTTATPFHICSCSKTFTAAVFSRLVQDGIAGWEQPVHEVLPELQFGDVWITRHCTFRDLACMRTGLSREGIAEWGIEQRLPKESRLARVRHMRHDAPFRDRFSYSNLGYIALSLAAERLAGAPYGALIQEFICKPLAMQDTFSAGFGVQSGAEIAAPAFSVMGAPSFVRDLTGPNSEGSARIHLSCRDAALWMHFLLEALAGSDRGPLWGASVRAMASPQAIAADADIRMAPAGDRYCAYGMGLLISRFRDRTLLRHSGGGRGWRHAMALAPEHRAGVLVMASAENPAIDGIALQMMEQLMGYEPKDWPVFFTRAAEQAAERERASVEAAFPAQGDLPAVAIPQGRYSNPLTGEVTIAADGRGLRFVPRDAPDFTATINALGGDTFELGFDEPALAPQPLDIPFRLRLVKQAGGPCLKTSYFGTLATMT